MREIADFSACLWPVASETREALATVRESASAHGPQTVMINTCQRVEVYSTALCACEAPVRRAGFDALLHLAEVAAGLHSVVLGEDQVLGQVRDALREAPAEVRPYAEAALAAARQLRREAAMVADTGELLDRSLALAEAPAGGHLLVLGFGQMGRAVARRGAALGYAVTVAARRQPLPGELPEGAAYVPLAETAAIGRVDVVAACLGSAAAPLAHAAMPEAGLYLDFGTPRNLPDRPGVRVVTIRDLTVAGPSAAEQAVRAALRLRLAELLERRLTMVRETSGTSVGRLRAAVEERRQREAERIRKLHPEIPADTVDTITRALVNRLFHAPSERLRTMADDDLGARVADLFAVEPHEAHA